LERHIGRFQAEEEAEVGGRKEEVAFSAAVCVVVCGKVSPRSA